MYARVAKWEGGEAEAIRAMAADIGAQAESGPPEGVPAKGFLMLTDPEGGRILGISLFETEEDLEQGDATLNEMSPGNDAVGRRTAVERYEVAIDARM